MDGDSNYGMYNPHLNEAGTHLLPVSRHPARLCGALCRRLPRHPLLGLAKFSDDRPLDLVSSRWLRRRSVLRHLGIRDRSIRFRRDRPARHHRVSQTTFWRRRLFRILPLHYLTCHVYVVFISPQLLFDKIWLNLLSHLLLVHNLIERWYGAINGVNWSLGVEMQF